MEEKEAAERAEVMVDAGARAAETAVVMVVGAKVGATEVGAKAVVMAAEKEEAGRVEERARFVRRYW